MIGGLGASRVCNKNNLFLNIIYHFINRLGIFLKKPESSLLPSSILVSNFQRAIFFFNLILKLKTR